jgi:hypothetical protein
MTSASNHEQHTEHTPEPARRPGRRRSLPVARGAATIAALLGVAALAAGCGGSNSNNQTPASSASPRKLMAQFLAYARCMRSHHVPNFPDPTTSGGIGIVLPHTFNTSSPAYQAANQACQALGSTAHPTTASAPKLAAEVKAAHCMRSHGLPSFPDPNSQGQFDRNRFDPASPAFRTAGNACKAVIAAAGPLLVQVSR